MSSSGQSLAGEYGSAVDDTVLVREAQKGNVKAFEELARHYDQAVLGLALHLTGSREAAQDMYQDVFLCAYQNLPHFRFECSFYTWLYRIVTKVGLDRLRRNQLQRLDVSEEVSTGGADEEPVAQTPDLQAGTCHEQSSTGHGVRQKIGRALSRLSARERMVFELKHYQGLKLHTVASLLNTTENIVKSTLLRATQKLRLAASEGAETL